MDKNLPDIEELFKSALENEEEMPEPKVWQAIESILDKDNVISIKKKYENLKRVAFLLFFLLTGLSIYELEKPSSGNNTILPKEIMNQKSSTTNAKAESASITKKATERSTHTSDKTKPSAKSLLVNGNSSANIAQPQLNRDFADSKKGAGDNKDSISNSKILVGRPIAVNLHAAAKKIGTDKATKEKLAEGNMKTDETLSLIDLHALYAIQSSPKNFDSVNTISLPRSPVLIKIIPASIDRKYVVKNAKAKNGKPSAFSVNVFFSPDFAYYRLQDNDPGNNVNDVSEIEKNETHEFSSTAGALLEYKVKNHWSIESGLTYSNTNITVAPKTIYAQPDNSGSIKYLLNTSSGYGYVLPSFSNNPTVGDSLNAFTSTHRLQYLGLPIAVKYTVNKGKFSFNALAGTTVNCLINGKIETSVENGISNEQQVVNSLQGLQTIYLSGLAGAGVEYRVNKKVGITFQPTYRFALNSINKNTPVKSFPNSIGFATGVRLSF